MGSRGNAAKAPADTREPKAYRNDAAFRRPADEPVDDYDEYDETNAPPVAPPAAAYFDENAYAPDTGTNIYPPVRPPVYEQPAPYQPPAETTNVYAPVAPMAERTNVYAPVAPAAADTNVYAPVYPGEPAPVSTFAPPASYVRTYAPPVAVDPMTEDARYDDDPVEWQGEPTRVGNPLFSPRVAPLTQNPAQGMTPSFGAPQPEPTAYLQDVQAGFAPPPTPEELYRRRSEPLLRELPEEAPAPAEPVHPGLDPAIFQQNIGLTGDEQLTDDRQTDAYADFTPFTASDSGADTAKPSNPFSLLAKRARSLVGGMDDEDLTIRDLQSTVDVKNAFHAPVYPKKKPESEDE